ncbi:MAG: hypothetical protein ACK5PS_11055 [Desulfopila sp.]
MGASFCSLSLWGLAVASAVLMGGCTTSHYLTVQADSITLFYQVPNATEVLFASSIDHFTLHPATRAAHDLWQVTIPKRDSFSYFYLIDKVPGIPRCELTVVDDFGARNCFFRLECNLGNCQMFFYMKRASTKSSVAVPRSFTVSCDQSPKSCRARFCRFYQEWCNLTGETIA